LSDLREQLQVDLGIERRRLDRSMAQDLGDILEPDVLTQHLARGRMPKNMRPTARRLNTGTLQRGSGNVRDRVSGLTAREGPERRYRAKENVLAGHLRAPSGEIDQKSIAHILWQRQPNLATSLPRYPDRGGLETQIREAQTRHVTGAQPEPDQ
jgi:hypothetical protein